MISIYILHFEQSTLEVTNAMYYIPQDATPTNGEPEQYVAQSLGTFPTTIVSTTSTDLKFPAQYIYTPHLQKVHN